MTGSGRIAKISFPGVAPGRRRNCKTYRDTGLAIYHYSTPCIMKKNKNPQNEEQSKGGHAPQPANIEDEKKRMKNTTDTAPDEFISPNADTDQPMDGHVVNDAVLFGEDHAQFKVDDVPENKDKPGKKQKKDVEKGAL